MKGKLLIVSALLAGSLTASAQWTEPVPEATPLAVDDTLYLYNVGAKMFFTQGNAWGTQASVGNTGLKVIISKYLLEEGAEWDGVTYEIKDSVATQSAIKNLFIDSEEALFVDRAAQANYLFSIVENGSYYRITGAPDNPVYNSIAYPDLYAGVKIEDGVVNTVIFPFLSAEEANIDWIFVSPAEYQRVVPLKAAYEASLLLKAQLENAASYTVDVAAEQAVYDNTSSTVEELNAATESVKKKIAEAQAGKATPDNPAFFTDLLANPRFEDGTATGWSGTAPEIQYNVGEHYNKTFDTYQKVKGLQQGVYGVRVKGYYRDGGYDAAYESLLAGTTTLNALLYGIADGDTLTVPLMSIFDGATATADEIVEGGTDVVCPTSCVDQNVWVPNMRYSANLYFQGGKYAGNEVIIPVATGDSLILGVKKTTGIGSDWCAFDDFELVYYGNSADSYKLILRKAINDLKEYPEDTKAQKSLLEDYNNLSSLLSTANTNEEVMAAVETVNSTAAALAENIAAYAAFDVVYEEAATENAAGTLTGSTAEELNDYLMEMENATEIGELSTEEINAASEKISSLLEQARKESIGVGTKIVFTNPDFSQGATGWEGAPEVENGVAEKYNTVFDCYQTLTDVPNGVYMLEASAFYRNGSNDAAAADYELTNYNDNVSTFIYINDSKQAVWNVMKDGSEEALRSGTGSLDDYQNSYSALYTPNGRAGANEYFNTAQKYKNSMYGIVTDNTIRFGIKNEATTPNARWSAFDNFVLTYKGTDASVLADVLQAQIDAANTILDNDVYCSAATKQALLDKISESETAIAEKDGTKMMALCSELAAAVDALNASIAVYATLGEKAEELSIALDEYSSTASEAALSNAIDLLDELDASRESGAYTDEEANAKVADVDAAITALKLPADDPSDDNPVDFTNLIVNPNYENNDNTGWAGTVPAVSYYCAEQYNKTFDYYQVISGIPNGTYEVTVQGFYRAGFADGEYTNFTENPEGTANAFLYAKSGDVTSSVALTHAFAEASEEMIGGNESSITVTDDEGFETYYYIPNNMEAASLYFDVDKYNSNKVIVKVTDGTLTIGIKKDVTINGDWTIYRNWTLTSYGSDSQRVPDEDASGIEGVDVAAASSVAYYSVNGARIAAPQKGINIVKSVVNGKVQIKKILVK